MFRVSFWGVVFKCLGLNILRMLKVLKPLKALKCLNI